MRLEGSSQLDQRHPGFSCVRSSKELLIGLLAKADIKINGGRPYDIAVNDERFFERIVKDSYLAVC